MGLMNIIRQWKEKNQQKTEKYKEMEEDYRLRKMLEDRQKSSNERELENYYKKQREEGIKQQVEKIHNKQTKEGWKSKYMYGGGATVLKQDKNILENNKKLLMNKSVFLDNKLNTPMTKQELFFKW